MWNPHVHLMRNGEYALRESFSYLLFKFQTPSLIPGVTISFSLRFACGVCVLKEPYKQIGNSL